MRQPAVVDRPDQGPDDVLLLVKEGTTTTVSDVSDDAEAIWSIGNIAGCRAIRVIATAYASGYTDGSVRYFFPVAARTVLATVGLRF